MSPTEPTTPPAESAETAETPPAATTPTGPEPAASSPSGPRGLFVPRWALGLLALVAVAALGFGIGRWTDDSDGHGRADLREAMNGRRMPQLPGNRRPVLPGNGSSNGGNQGPSSQLPSNQLPTAPQSGVFLGVSVQDSTSPQGAQVVSVVPGSPADAAGIKAGDVITAADGTVTSASQLATRVQAHNSGDQISVTYNRSGSSTTVQVKLGSRSASSAPVA